MESEKGRMFFRSQRKGERVIQESGKGRKDFRGVREIEKGIYGSQRKGERILYRIQRRVGGRGYRVFPHVIAESNPLNMTPIHPGYRVTEPDYPFWGTISLPAPFYNTDILGKTFLILCGKYLYFSLIMT